MSLIKLRAKLILSSYGLRNKSLIFASLLIAVGALSFYTPLTGAGNTAAITIHADNGRQVVTTDAETVGEVLNRADIELSEHDVVEPEVDAEITNNTFNINVYRARPVVIVDGDDVHKIESAHRSARLIAKNAEEIDIHKEDKLEAEVVTDFLNSDYLGYKVTIDRATPVSLQIANKDLIIRTHATTVEGMLEEENIELSDDDIVKPALDTPIKEDMKVTLTRVNIETVTFEEEISPSIQTVYDNNRPHNYRKVETPGTAGLALVTYEIEYRNGKEVKRNRIRRIIEEEPEPRVVVVGNKPNYSGGPLNQAQITFLGNCESGMNPTTNTGNGFYGAFQFMPSTWRAVHNGPYSMPHEAPLAVQVEAVQTLLSRASIFTQFPSCARQMQAAGLL